MKVGVLGSGKAGTILPYIWELAMAYDAGLRVVAMQLLQELVEGCFLLRSTRIGSLTTSANAAFVTDAE